MANTPLGDIPGGRFHVPYALSHASVATDGATARLGQIGPFAHDIKVRNAWWTPTGADQPAGNSASYRRLTVWKAASDGASVTATASRIASLNNTASHASLAPLAMTVNTAVTVSSGQVIYFSQETVGGNHNDGTTLVAGQLALAYEIL